MLQIKKLTNDNFPFSIRRNRSLNWRKNLLLKNNKNGWILNTLYFSSFHSPLQFANPRPSFSLAWPQPFDRLSRQFRSFFLCYYKVMKPMYYLKIKNLLGSVIFYDETRFSSIRTVQDVENMKTYDWE